jgi:hypothetical protein
MPLRSFLPAALLLLFVYTTSTAQWWGAPVDHGENYGGMAPEGAGNRWGYGYDSLRADLERWRTSPFVRIDSIGTSVLGRTIWELTITAESAPTAPRHTVYVHARTHPNEVEGTYVVNEIIRALLSDEPWARSIRERTTFHIVPMYNPDGVELEFPRENANGLDLERQWDKDPMEPETAALKQRFLSLMGSEEPIEVAINLHSAYVCKRYFVYHDPTGTSTAYSVLEQRFIEAVRSFFIEGIEPWSYNRTWVGSAPTHFPESFFWYTHGANVIALTYEDMNCASHGSYDRTGVAIVRGIAEYLGISFSTGVPRGTNLPLNFTLEQNYPNPFSGYTTIRYTLPQAEHIEIALYNTLGEKVQTITEGFQGAGSYDLRFNSGTLPEGVYIYRLNAGGIVESRRLAIVRR